jgi:predicted translin family RNA/ssDNA-binding protein
VERNRLNGTELLAEIKQRLGEQLVRDCGSIVKSLRQQDFERALRAAHISRGLPR